MELMYRDVLYADYAGAIIDDAAIAEKAHFYFDNLLTTPWT